MKIVIFLGFLIIFKMAKGKTDWCSLTCNGEANIACEVGGNCNSLGECRPEPFDKEKVVEMHNKLRNTFAGGHENRAKGLTVADMVALTWDDDLAFTAKCNLARCLPYLNHDSCRITPRFRSENGSAGQCLGGMFLWDDGPNCDQQAPDVVWRWYAEVNLTDLAGIRAQGKYYQFDYDTGHFTQLVWAKTTHVGCALAKSEGVDVFYGQSNYCIMACNYGPSGNFDYQQMFTEGKPCSKCPDNLKCGKTYKYLCGDGGVPSDWRSAADSISHVISADTLVGAFLYVALLSLVLFGK